MKLITENNVLKTLIKTEGFFKEFSAHLKYMFLHIKEWTDATFDDVKEHI